ncbi:MAG: acetylxylan esterase [Pirellulales bacterium]
MPRLILALFALLLGALPLPAAGPVRVLPEGSRPADARLGALKDLDGYFPFTPARSREAWQQRAEQVRRQILVSQGLWPMPEKTPANAVVHGLVDRGDYTVERVYFESVPGHFVTGSLYRPKGYAGKRPAVLFPHGHWAQGRFHDMGEKALREELFHGAERFERSGRTLLQSGCVQLARMGCVVFHYDMIGYADSRQLEHRPAPEIRPHMNTKENWGYFSPQAELRLQNMMGLQTYNSLRALDWVCGLPDVDASKIGVTGASGGGTQTFILGALDPRPAAIFPAVMVSTAMQGGCTCENAPLLRVETGNVEFAALFAPKPLGMTGADDWTKEIATKGLPELKRHYALFGAEDHVQAWPLVQFGHNLNYVSRGLMYTWFNQHLGLGKEQPIVAEDYEPLSVAEMTVWDAAHPVPPSGDDYERTLLRQLTEASDRQLAALTPKDAASLTEYRRVVGGALEAMIGRGLPKAGEATFDLVDKSDRGSYWFFKGLVKNAAAGESLPTVFLHPKQWSTQEVVVWLDGRGKQGLFDSQGAPTAPVAKLLEQGYAVAGVDLLYQGEFLDNGPLEQTREVGKAEDYGKQFAGYTFGYNPTLFAQRVRDALSVVSYVAHDEHEPQGIVLVGVEGAGPIAIAAAAVAGDAVNRVAADTGGFRFAQLERTNHPDFLPGAVKYGDLPGLAALLAGKPLWLAGEAEAAPVLAAAYAASGTGKSPVLGQVGELVAWIVSRK